MKKLLSILLAAVLAFSMIACQKPVESSSESQEESKPIEEPATYTYNYALAEFPTVWNVHTYQTNTDSEIVGYITAGFYTFDYNENEDGYKVVPDMATEEPVDVTKDYVGKFGITEDSKSQAYIIKLRNDLKWEDGTPINANDFVESAKRLEEPKAQNYRADNFYSGNMVIHNAKNYLYQGKTVQLDNGVNECYTLDDLTKGDDGAYLTPAGGKVFIGLDFPLDWCSGNSLKDYVDAYGEDYFDVTNWEALIAMVDDNGLIPLTDENYELFAPVTTGNPAWGETEDDIPNYLVYEETFAEMSWDEVGIQALSDYELLLVLDKPLKGFYLLYSLTDSWLVKNDLYDKCVSEVDGVFTNTYGTSAETTMSYGPYKLTSFQADKQFTLAKNEYYFGYNDSDKFFQTTNVVVDCVAEPATRLELFLQGKLDSYGLNKEDMETYSRSDNTYYDPGDSTYAMVFNPDFDALVKMQEAAGEKKNKTIITISEFRQAMSFGMDRAAFCLATSPTNGPAYAVYSNLIISNPEEGTPYRTTTQAKQAMVNFWGLAEEIGEGKMYKDMDEAIESITGYNLAKAKELFDVAYDKAVEAGYMTEEDVVEIKIGTPNNTSSFYNNGYEYIVNNYTEAVKGTKLEGKLTFTRDDTLGNGFSDALKSNQVDMLFGVGWTGSTLDPYGLMEAYVAPNYQYDPAWDTSTDTLEIEVNGKKMTATVIDWCSIMAGDVCTVKLADGTTQEYSCGEADEDPETRLDILAALENKVLMNYDFIPLMDASTASMKGMQLQYHTEEYVFGMGHGGIKYLTYNYNDAEWDEYVSSQGGELDYK